ncbi:hypothetical protein ABZ671_17180 [Micromonospora sp. NPDC006766]|uniref:hypothetical protein n=1 Tax=Micromonospora sp. NPDC006766 TaxID=3154778 RepID=UPI0033C61BC3
MSYGLHLDQAAAALSRTWVMLRQPPAATSADYLAVVAARVQFYRAIERQIGRFGGIDYESDLLQQLKNATGEDAAPTPLQEPSAHPIAVALRGAADAAGAASDILNAQFHPTTGAPVSSEGFAIKAGVDRFRNIARLAQLARAASEIDGPLAQWLGGAAARSSPPFVTAAIEKAERTHASLQIAAAAAIQQARGTSRLQALEPPPLLDDVTPWAHIRSPDDFTAAVDAARTWLVQNRTTLTAADFRTLTRAGMALTYEADYLVGLGSNAAGLAHVVRSTTTTSFASMWRRAARAADHLHSLGRPEPGVGPAALAKAEEWLRRHVRNEAGWQRWADLRQHVDPAAWKGMGRDLAARLPDLAALVNRGARMALHRGELYEQISPQGSQGIRRSGWARARTNQGKGFDLVGATGQLRGFSMMFVRESGVTPLPGIHEADPRNQDGRAELRATLRRIAGTKAVVPEITGRTVLPHQQSGEQIESPQRTHKERDSGVARDQQHDLRTEGIVNQRREGSRGLEN